MEKPGSQDLAAFERLIATVKEKNLVFHIGYMYRYNPMVLELMQQIERGELGQIVCVEAQMSGNQGKKLRQWLPTFKGGQMFYLGCHIIDLAFRILGQPTQVLPLNFATGVEGVECDALMICRRVCIMKNERM
jgi:predicted dehydrogenase